MLFKLIGAPLQAGASCLGCEMGPSALRTARLADTLRSLDHQVIDIGDVRPKCIGDFRHPNAAIKALLEVVACTERFVETAYRESESGFPIFMVGDHVLSAGTLAGISHRGAQQVRHVNVVWPNAHPA